MSFLRWLCVAKIVFRAQYAMSNPIPYASVSQDSPSSTPLASEPMMLRRDDYWQFALGIRVVAHEYEDPAYNKLRKKFSNKLNRMYITLRKNKAVEGDTDSGPISCRLVKTPDDNFFLHKYAGWAGKSPEHTPLLYRNAAQLSSTQSLVFQVPKRPEGISQFGKASAQDVRFSIGTEKPVQTHIQSKITPQFFFRGDSFLSLKSGLSPDGRQVVEAPGQWYVYQVVAREGKESWSLGFLKGKDNLDLGEAANLNILFVDLEIEETHLPQ